MTNIGLYDFTVKKGDSWDQVLTFRDSTGSVMDITGYVARMDIKASQADSSNILALTSSGSTANMTIAGSSGTVTIAVANSVTSAITADSGVYDLQLATSSGNVKTYLEGKVTFIDDITR